MLSISKLLCQYSMRPILQVIPRQIHSIGALYAAFTTRDLSAGSHGEAGTLISRFIKHIALEKCKTDPLIPQKIKYSSYYPVTDLTSFRQSIRNIATDQIPRLIIFTYTYKTNGDPQKVTQVLNIIDSLCLDRVEEMDQDTLLSTLYALMFLLPNKITKFEFFSRCIQRLVAELREDCTKERFVEICFYLGLWKKHRRSMELMDRIVSTHLERYIKDLNEVELAIVVNALFKSSTTCENVMFKERLINGVLNCDGNDDSILVTFVKSLRLNRIKSDKLLEKIIELKKQGKIDRMQFKGIAHLFALLADGLYNNPEICEDFTELCLDKLENMDSKERYAFNDIRAKDVSTFIWSCATLRCNSLLSKHYTFLENIILNKVDRDEYKYSQDDLIDTVLSLWILGYKSHELVQAVFSLRKGPMPENLERVKLESRFELLKSCIQIEQPKWLPTTNRQQKLFDEERIAPNYIVEKQPNLENLRNIIEENKDDLGVKMAKFVMPIHQLNIAGILLEVDGGKKCFLEALEASQMLRFGSKPVSFVDLKLRLLEHLGYSVYVMQPDLDSVDVLSRLKEWLSGLDGPVSLKKRAV